MLPELDFKKTYFLHSDIIQTSIYSKMAAKGENTRRSKQYFPTTLTREFYLEIINEI